ncbi:MAG: iron ABC transporter permease [Blastocatellia bacterium]|nr:iron ABC transporter permease [Blastocatellia bacterium]
MIRHRPTSATGAAAGERRAFWRALFERGPATPKKVALVCGMLSVLLLLSAVIALHLGSEPVSHAVVLEVLRTHLFGTTQEPTVSEIIVWRIRGPRILLGLAAGAALAVAGALLQALLRNPLAEPYVLGISGGAALGAILAVLGFEEVPLMRPSLAFAGAALATALVYAMSRSQAGMFTERLVLAGLILATLLWATIALLLALVPDSRLRGLTFWMMGDLSGGGNGLLPIVFGIVLAAIALAYRQARRLNLLMVGEEEARVLGLDVERVKTVTYLLASLLAGVIVSVAGAIGFVGLLVPHLVRLLWGSDNRLVIPAAALSGAILVVLADAAARTVLAPRELPVGAVMASLGAPVFILLLRRA